MAAVTRQYRAGQVLFKEGEASRCMYLVKKGTIAVRKMKGSAYVEIARVYPNEVIGELSFFDRQPRSATAVAVTDLDVIEIDFVALDKIYAHVPDYLKSIMIAVAERLRKANETIRRLQKNVVYENPADDPGNQPEGPDALAILAATQDIDLDAHKKSGGGEGSEEGGA